MFYPNYFSFLTCLQKKKKSYTRMNSYNCPKTTAQLRSDQEKQEYTRKREIIS